MSDRHSLFRRLLAAHILVAAPLLASASLAQTAAPPAAAAAGEGDRQQMQEIVVTAEHRSTRLQETPVSIAAFTAKRLDAQGLRGIDDLSRLTPGVSFERIGETSASNYNDENSDIAIRGIDSNAGTSTTGVYVDDTPIQTRHLGFGTVNAFPALFDLDRVEVLRGPQGTLFGGGSEGGTVRFITPEPSLTSYSGYLRSELADTENGAPTYELAGAAGGPIIDDKLGFRLSASFRNDGGFVDRVHTTLNAQGEPVAAGIAEKDANWQRTEAVRLALKWTPTDNLTISPSLLYQQLSLNDTAAFWPSLSNVSQGKFLNGNAQADQSYDPFYLATLKAVWDAKAVTLTSVFSAFIRDQATNSDYTQFDRAVFAPSPYGGPGDAGNSYFNDRQRNFTAEFRASSNNADQRLTWTAGLYISYAHEAGPQSIYDPTIGAESGGLLPVNTPEIAINSPFYELDRTYALYGQADYKLTPELKLTVGLRVSDEETAGKQKAVGPFYGPNNPVLVAEGAFRDVPVTPKFGLSYAPDRDHLYYATAAKGYRDGGLNLGLVGLCATDLANLGLTTDPLKYAPDSLWSFEGGTKTTMLNGALVVDASLFYIKWNNIQQNVYLPTCGDQFADNLGGATSKGGDLTITYRPTPQLQLGLEGGYADARYDKTVYGGATGKGAAVVSNGDLVTTVPWTLNASAEYQLPMIADQRPYVRADYQFSAAQDGETTLQDPNDGVYDPRIPKTPQTNNLSLRGGLRRHGLDVSLFVNNALDSHPILVVSHDTYASPLFFDRTIRPRTFGLTTTYRF